MKKNLFLLVFVSLLSGCYVHNFEGQAEQQKRPFIIEQEKLSSEVINYLKTVKNIEKNGLIIDSVDLKDTIFVTTTDTTLCSKKYYYYNNTLTPTTFVSPCDYSKPRNMCLMINYEFLSYKKRIGFKFYKQNGKIDEGYFYFMNENNKHEFYDLFFNRSIVE